jgi:hypothetical protein
MIGSGSIAGGDLPIRESSSISLKREQDSRFKWNRRVVPFETILL